MQISCKVPQYLRRCVLSSVVYKLGTVALVSTGGIRDVKEEDPPDDLR